MSRLEFWRPIYRSPEGQNCLHNGYFSAIWLVASWLQFDWASCEENLEWFLHFFLIANIKFVFLHLLASWKIKPIWNYAEKWSIMCNLVFYQLSKMCPSKHPIGIHVSIVFQVIKSSPKIISTRQRNVLNRVLIFEVLKI